MFYSERGDKFQLKPLSVLIFTLTYYINLTESVGGFNEHFYSENLMSGKGGGKHLISKLIMLIGKRNKNLKKIYLKITVRVPLSGKLG